MIECQPEVETSFGGARRNGSHAQSGLFHPEKRGAPLMTLVDRVQDDFPRTPSPVFGCPSGSSGALPVRSLDQSMAAAMKQLNLENAARLNAHQQDYRNQRTFAPAAYQPRAHDLRQPQRVQSHPAYASPYPVVTPPGFHASTARGIYGSAMANDPRSPWARSDDLAGFPSARFSVAPMDYGMMPPPSRVSHKGDFYPNRFGSGLGGGPYNPHNVPVRAFQGHPHPIFPMASGYGNQDHQVYGIPHQAPVYRSKSGPVRRTEYPIHPAHSYSSTSLLEEFKGAAKSDKWDLRTIQGHLLEFARDQAGSRFIQLKLEKADDRVRNEAFNEVYPEALLLMTDVFGNYVIQKFFDHGSIEQQSLLVNLMKSNMVNLALQVYGCRVIQKALEVSQVDEQLLLIQEMRGHVLKCVTDQNGNHVLQKCIEAASWKKDMKSSGIQHHVQGEDIQFIIDDFIGQVAVLSTHAYGCRVIQRVLEHCSPDQIRPIVNEIIFKCRELVKDQFGNYVVQHVVSHGEMNQRNIVMQAILPEVAKWSQHKYASNVVEACLDCATSGEISQVIDIILDCDESGSSCALLPMMKHMYGNYVVQKLLDRADRNDRQRIVRIIQHNADYLKRFTYGKHVLSRLERESSGNHRHPDGHGRYY
jgi:pumilio RNA-binding family